MANRWRIVFLLALCAVPSLACARDQLRIVGSSTVFPFVAAAAEQFGHAGKFRTPIVEVNGTGGGFKMFCDGVGERFPDIADASRPIKPSETERCAQNGIRDIAEFKIGYDGIVFANAIGGVSYPLTKRMLFLALARDVPVGGQLVANPYKRWSEIDKSLPDYPIDIYGPPPAEGTRDAFVELVMNPACKAMPEFMARYRDEVVRTQQCGALREDGRFVEVLGGNVMIQKLVNNSHALGIFSFSFLDQNRALVKANPVDNVAPTFDAIVGQKYGVARSLFIYVKREHLSQVKGLAEFVRFLLSDAATGEDGFLVVKGLIPLSVVDHDAVKKAAGELR